MDEVRKGGMVQLMCLAPSSCHIDTVRVSFPIFLVLSKLFWIVSEQTCPSRHKEEETFTRWWIGPRLDNHMSPVTTSCIYSKSANAAATFTHADGIRSLSSDFMLYMI